MNNSFGKKAMFTRAAEAVYRRKKEDEAIPYIRNYFELVRDFDLFLQGELPNYDFSTKGLENSGEFYDFLRLKVPKNKPQEVLRDYLNILKDIGRATTNQIKDTAKFLSEYRAHLPVRSLIAV
ncbi:MAG: hypothetical protein Q7S06_03115 [Nanoarchaeota archaeon]|nr:hypothetical protein [Nanoarchaeota archaeon]